ncbi:hypothetical protein AKO1_014418 [Acrasis kona]|uniref:UDP-glucuronosyltransferase n=1 Tax=Acrasis kona TaxID=1008807 RepID=A0AAW2Z144_9EUKA
MKLLITILLLCVMTSARPRILFSGSSGNTANIVLIQIARVVNSNQDYQLSFGTFDEFKTKVDSLGTHVRFIDYGKNPSHIPVELAKAIAVETTFYKSMANITSILLRTYEPTFKALEPIFKDPSTRPHVLVSDYFDLAGPDLADHYSVPVVIVKSNAQLDFGGFFEMPRDLPDRTLGHGLQDMKNFKKRLWQTIAPAWYMTGYMIPIWMRYDQLSNLRRRFGINVGEAKPFGSLDDRIVICCTSFGFEYARPISTYTHLVGLLHEPYDPSTHIKQQDMGLMNWLDQSEQIVVYVSFGTLVRPLDWHLENLVRGVLMNSSARVLIATTSQHDASLLQDIDASRVRIEPWVNQQMVLHHARTRVFISHGGGQSIAEGLSCGMPMLILPFMSDQLPNAIRLFEMGAGLYLNKADFTAQEVYEKMMRLLNEDGFRERSKHLYSVSLTYGHERRAAEIVVNTLEVGEEHLKPFDHDFTFLQKYNLDVHLLIGCAMSVLTFSARLVITKIGKKLFGLIKK